VTGADRTVTITGDWAGDADVDFYVYADTGGSSITSACGTSNHPESCSVTLTPGTWLVRVTYYEGNAPYSLLVE
jgi:hypothetical protein